LVATISEDVKHSIMKWQPDSCPCIIKINLPENTLANVIQKCNLHKDMSGKKLLDAISSHNKKFASQEMIEKRREEYTRILKMDNPKVCK